MDPIIFILPVLFHRIGLILTFVGSVLLILLPVVFTLDNDGPFVLRTYKITVIIIRAGLILLLITGVIRLQSGIPRFFLIKLILATFTIILGFIPSPEFASLPYRKYSIGLLVLVCSTAMVGILI